MGKPLGARRWFGGNCAAGSSKKSGGGDASLAPPNHLLAPSGLRITLPLTCILTTRLPFIYLGPTGKSISSGKNMVLFKPRVNTLFLKEFAMDDEFKFEEVEVSCDPNDTRTAMADC
ncbi:MAG: hypothetical protein HYW48_01655 [Deltaproteobacteria bacterium]|nr:hypothetical protein [Deltaproteobacteria bacterium]